MTTKKWESLSANACGLTKDLFVPIAADTIETIENYVGDIEQFVKGRKRAINAVVVRAHRPKRDNSVPLWSESKSEFYYQTLHPERQLWVHVDYYGYRRAWERLGFGKLNQNVFLDHILNRKFVRLNNYQCPFVRLCPVSRETNTNSGLVSGMEGIQIANFENLDQNSEDVIKRAKKALAAPIVLADPMDMTKMLDIPPGLSVLDGVAKILKKFYATDTY